MISKYELDKFVFMSFYCFDTNSKNHLAYTYIYWKFYFVKELKANLLVDNNIMGTERIIIDLANKIIIISSCQITISITTRFRSHAVQMKVFIDWSLIIFLKSESLVQFVYFGLLGNCNFFFNPTPHNYLMLFSQILTT